MFVINKSLRNYTPIKVKNIDYFYMVRYLEEQQNTGTLRNSLKALLGTKDGTPDTTMIQ